MRHDIRLATASVLVAALAPAVLLAGCGSKNQAGEDSMAAGDSITGTVRQVGNAPFTRIVVEGENRSVQITGSLEEEIAHLVGARLRVVGEPSEGEIPGDVLEATGYEIFSVDGETPRVGILRHTAGEGYRLATESGEEVALQGVPDGLGTRVGAKVWILVGEGGAVQRYGILRMPEDAGG